MKTQIRILILCFIFLYTAFLQPLKAQDNRLQYPGFLRKAYFKVNVGYIQAPFTNQQLQQGFSAEAVHVSHVAASLILFGYQFDPHISAQISYMRPVNWIEYKNINGDNSSHSVWLNIVGLTVKGIIPIMNKLSLYGEGGLGIVTRHGIKINDQPVLTDASYATVQIGAGVQYKINNHWDLTASFSYLPGSDNMKEPYTAFYGGGCLYHIQPLSREKILNLASAGYIFPLQLVQVGYSTNAFGYKVNNLVSHKVPIFWGGDAQIEHGIWLGYQRNIFHTKKVFSFDWGADFSYWESNQADNDFFTFSVFPLIRFTFIRSSPLDLYFNYSAAGPAYISRIMIDDKNTGKHFTFQDFMGIGTFVGKNRNLNAEIRIAHYSNGNIFPNNAGVKIPLMFNLGYTF